MGSAAALAGVAPCAAGSVAVRRLQVTAFRSWPRARIEVGPQPVVLTGPNGAGKTNLLEALSWLGPGRGLRGARLADLAQRGADAPWAVAAEIAAPQGAVKIATGAAPGGEGERRLVRIDGRAARSPAALAEVVSMVWLTPAMDGLFREAPQGRRRLFDRLVAAHDPLHIRRYGAYERAMRERIRLLREGCRDAAWLAALEETMAETGVAVAAARRDLACRLAPVLAEGTAPFPGAALALAGSLEGWLSGVPALEAEQRFRQHLERGRTGDGEAGATACGPHRSDLAVTHLATGMAAALCSTGQQKALVIALLLAAARLEAQRRPPLLLLDDVVAHLDAAHRQALFALLLELGLQAWMTGSDPAPFASLGGRCQRFAIAAGRQPAPCGPPVP